jgi:hypothetical protein
MSFFFLDCWARNSSSQNIYYCSLLFIDNHHENRSWSPLMCEMILPETNMGWYENKPKLRLWTYTTVCIKYQDSIDSICLLLTYLIIIEWTRPRLASKEYTRLLNEYIQFYRLRKCWGLIFFLRTPNHDWIHPFIFTEQLKF